jgi:hypothetical protein
VVGEITKRARYLVALSAAFPVRQSPHQTGPVASILQHHNHTDLEFRKIIFCGSVVRYKFRFEEYSSRFEQPLVNEVGTRAVWPVLAATLT